MVFPFNTTSTKNTTIYVTNDCHLFAANACARSAGVKQAESLKFFSVDLKPPGYKPQIKAPDTSPPNISPPDISPPVICPPDISP